MKCEEYFPPNSTNSSGVVPDVPTQALSFWSSILTNKISVAICCFGVLGNILNLMALTRRSLQSQMGRMEKSATTGLVALALSDLTFCVLYLPHASIDYEKDYWFTMSFDIYYRMYGIVLINIFVLSSTWLTVFMALSRYLAICHPLHARIIVDMKFAKASIIVVFIGSVLANLPRFWHFALKCQVKGDVLWYTYVEGPLGRSTPGWRAFIICYLLFGVLIPLFILSFCNVYLVRALQQSARMRNQFTRRDHTSSADTTRIVTLTLSIIVLANIILVAPSEIFIFVDQISPVQVNSPKLRAVYMFIVAVLNVLQIINFSFNFIMYIIINAHFRRAMKEVLQCGPVMSALTNGSASGHHNYDSVTASTHVALDTVNHHGNKDNPESVGMLKQVIESG